MTYYCGSQNRVTFIKDNLLLRLDQNAMDLVVLALYFYYHMTVISDLLLGGGVA